MKFREYCRYLFLLLFLPGVLLAQTVRPGPDIASQSLDAAALIRKIETQYQGMTSHGTCRMTVKTKSYDRTMVLESWAEGRNKFIARILEPAKERGTATLKVDSQIWNFLPKIDRLMKIPSSLMGDKWMGSHLTNDDLVKDAKIDETYTFTILEKNEKTAVIQGTPKPDAAVVWGKVIYRADLERQVPIAIEYFDEDGVKVRVIHFDQVEQVQGRWLPRVFRVEPLEQPGEYTEMHYEKIIFDVNIPQGTFSTQNLRSL
ncbi:MAG: outer membrane lipoprotein-sorting protein [Candidatus Riflebacteria bacterium]|nr:outer membrane lipoprotein-sorting protein [Candidatus Riflebacteria bacterium]